MMNADGVDLIIPCVESADAFMMDADRVDLIIPCVESADAFIMNPNRVGQSYSFLCISCVWRVLISAHLCDACAL
jgi:hypothetical protein